MKKHKIIIVLLILLSVSTYADDKGAVVGYTQENCSGNWLQVTNFNTLYDYHDDWEFKSYLYLSDPDTCYPFEEPVKATGTVPTTTGGSSGGSSAGGGGRDDNQNGNNGVSTGGGSPDDAASQFTDEMNDNLEECWQDAVVDDEAIQNWKGEHTDTKWNADSDFDWVLDKSSTGALGVVNYGTNPHTNEPGLIAYLFLKDIQSNAQDMEIPFLHLVLYAQVHEYTHVLQWDYYQTLHPEAEDYVIPPPYMKYGMEVEAYQLGHKLFYALTGMGAPLLLSSQMERIPREWRANKKKYLAAEKTIEELEEKQAEQQANGDELTDEELKKLKKAKEDKENLTMWFNDPENQPRPDAKSASYDSEEQIDCQLGDAESEEDTTN
ncbi:MAG: hypothetical protein OXO49_04405 [Gammaproteobacteria bacterium]|nr:hypothetical protein [Gammaproteobacteria bacterium]MDE0252227.1 hypothetical protein [Gammaproteobacteria bacterium]MDE0402664.1 hypothetical protein [Gammaproteobacteria bacterium]